MREERKKDSKTKHEILAHSHLHEPRGEPAVRVSKIPALAAVTDNFNLIYYELLVYNPSYRPTDLNRTVCSIGSFKIATGPGNRNLSRGFKE